MASRAARKATTPTVGSWSAPSDPLTTSVVQDIGPGASCARADVVFGVSCPWLRTECRRVVDLASCLLAQRVFTERSCHTVVVIDDALMDALSQSQRLGFLGDRPIADVVEHARAFVTALEGVSGRVADLGSGGGVPGLVIAHDRPDLQLVLIDRRAKRTDFLDRIVRRLGWGDRVSVLCADVEAVIAAGDQVVDATVARGFGPPTWTLELGTGLVRPGGITIISEPPEGDRWPVETLAELGVYRIDDGSGPVSIFRKAAD